MYNFIYVWAFWVFVAVWAFLKSFREWGYSLLVVWGLLIVVTSYCRAQASECEGFSSCSTWILEHRFNSCSTWV